MDWKNAFGTLRRGRLPLDARVGHALSLQTWPLMHAYGSGSLIAPPEQDSNTILAISQLKLNLTGVLYRYHLAGRDPLDSACYLQVYQDGCGELAELLYCTRLARLVPGTAAQQDAYTGALGCGLGDNCYTLWRTQLVDCGFGEEDLNFAFGADDGLDYARDAGDPDTGFIPPYTGTETAAGGDGTAAAPQQLHFMPYARELGGVGGKEYLLITAASRQADDGAGRRRLHVDFAIGIPVQQVHIVSP